MKKSLLALCILHIVFCSQASFGQYRYRLVGCSSYINGASTLTDSIRFSYSNGRGGKVVLIGPNPDWSSLKYDTCEVFHFNQTNYYFNHSRTIIQYNPDGTPMQKLGLGYDSTGKQWILLSSSVYSYDSQRNLILEFSQIANMVWGGMENYRRIYYRYDLKDRLILDSVEAWAYGQNTAFWQPDAVGDFQYDQNNNRIYEHYKIGAYEHSKTYYSFNSKNLLDSSKELDYNANNNYWYWYWMNIYNYNSFNKTDSTRSYQWQSSCSCWDPAQRNLNYYDANHNLILSDFAMNNGFGLRNQSRDSFDLDSRGDMKGYYNLVWDVPSAQYKLNTKVLYDSYTPDHQPYNEKVYDINSGALNNIQYFYYEPYIPASINEYKLNISSFQAFPSPANQYVSVSLKCNTIEDLRFNIVNAEGRLFAQWEDKVHEDYFKQIPVSHLPSGTYFIVVKSNEGSMSKAFKVLH